KRTISVSKKFVEIIRIRENQEIALSVTIEIPNINGDWIIAGTSRKRDSLAGTERAVAISQEWRFLKRTSLQSTAYRNEVQLSVAIKVPDSNHSLGARGSRDCERPKLAISRICCKRNVRKGTRKSGVVSNGQKIGVTCITEICEDEIANVVVL